MQLTPNYNLKKPEGTDPVDIQDFNDNADAIDAALKKKAESSGGDISEMTVKTLDNITTDFPVPVAGEKPKSFLGKVKKFFEDTKSWMTGVCLIGQIVNNCVTNNAKLPLSAAQGKVLMDLYTVLNTNLEGYYSLSGGTRIPSGADMLADTYRVPGNYACIDNTIASTLKNCPISKAFILKVDLSTGNAYPRQTFLQFNNGKVFTRVFDAFENKWAETFSNITNADLIHGNTDAFSIPANSERRITIDLSRYNVGTNYRLYAVVRGSTWANVGAIYCNNNQTIIDTRNLNSTAVNISLWYTVIRK